MGFTELLINTDLDAHQRDYARTIHKSANNLLTIIDDILDLSKIESGKLEITLTRYNIIDIIEDVIDLLAPIAYEKNIELIYNIDRNVPHIIESDPVRVRQILLNLVGNAVKFTLNGYVYLNVEADAQAEQANLKFTVADTGIGMDQDSKQTLFTAFTQADTSITRKFGGTGLGLVISRKLVLLMNGEIGFDSTLGEGSTFWFTVPVSVIAQNSDDKSGELAGTHIGLIDEHILCRRALKSMFEQWGCKVTEYSLDRCLTDPQFVDHDQIHIIVVGISRKHMQQLDQYGSCLGRLSEHAPVMTVVSTRSYTELGNISTGGFCNLTFRTARRPQIQQSMLDCLKNQTPTIIPGKVEVPASTEVSFNPSLKVLVVDDNDINLRLAEIILKKNNYDVTTICSGEESIELVRYNRYDLIFMDLHMPGLDGYETANRIRLLEDTDHHPVIIALTANAMPQEIERIESSGMDDVLIKPISEQLICDIISKWFSVPSVKVEHQTEQQTEDNIAEIFSIEDARKLANGNEALAMELFTMLIDELPEHRREILQARKQNDLKMLREVTHKLNGASRCCGTPALRHAANSLENSITHGDKNDSINEKTDLLLAEIDRLLEMEMPAKPGLPGSH